MLSSGLCDEDEVPFENRILYITPTLYGLVQDLDTTKSREVLERFSKVVLVPQTRFYTAIDLYDGTTSGETAGGYVKDSTNGKNINFMVVLLYLQLSLHLYQLQHQDQKFPFVVYQPYPTKNYLYLKYYRLIF